MDEQYLFDDFESESVEWFSKNKEEPFIYKMNNILYPNPEFLSESMPDDVDSRKTHMCIFCIDYACVLPFVKYVLFPDKTNETVDLLEMQELESLFEPTEQFNLFKNNWSAAQVLRTRKNPHYVATAGVFRFQTLKLASSQPGNQKS